MQIGITGGIGSGKSVICRVLTELGYPVFSSDQAAKSILHTDPELRSKLMHHFGDDLYAGQILQTERLAQLVFGNLENRLFVNNLVHPKVRSAFEAFARASKSKLVFNEAAILFETGNYRLFDKMILVVAPLDLRIKRIMQRDGMTEELILKRMAAQWSDEEKMPLSDYVIYNDEKAPVLAQLEKIIAELLNSTP